MLFAQFFRQINEYIFKNKKIKYKYSTPANSSPELFVDGLECVIQKKKHYHLSVTTAGRRRATGFSICI